MPRRDHSRVSPVPVPRSDSCCPPHHAVCARCSETFRTARAGWQRCCVYYSPHLGRSRVARYSVAANRWHTWFVAMVESNAYTKGICKGCQILTDACVNSSCCLLSRRIGQLLDYVRDACTRGFIVNGIAQWAIYYVGQHLHQMRHIA